MFGLKVQINQNMSKRKPLSGIGISKSTVLGNTKNKSVVSHGIRSSVNLKSQKSILIPKSKLTLTNDDRKNILSDKDLNNRVGSQNEEINENYDEFIFNNHLLCENCKVQYNKLMELSKIYLVLHEKYINLQNEATESQNKIKSYQQIEINYQTKFLEISRYYKELETLYNLEKNENRKLISIRSDYIDTLRKDIDRLSIRSPPLKARSPVLSSEKSTPASSSKHTIKRSSKSDNHLKIKRK